jgi:two-component system sensor histidine kinase BaeS
LEFLQVDLVALVNDAVESWGGRAAAGGVVLRAEVPPQPVYVRTDPGRIRQVLDGLLENALRVLSSGAPLTVAVRPPGSSTGYGDEATLAFPVAGQAPPLLNVSTVEGTAAGAPRGSGWPYAILEVRDGGPGFTDDDLAVVFERGALYERYKGVRKVGTGMGLALAARLVYRLGGAIEAGHAAEGGARFTVRLPQ